MERRRQARWDIGHMRTVSCRVPVEVSAALIEACRRQHTTRHRVLCAAVRQFIDQSGVEACHPDWRPGPPEAQPR